ncbi:alpha-glucosidase [Magnaporthiopsis poae ATCC 64411]|uniref:Alpha-glucosidase n=1 Tax=Magnaporthiopsis poae (strain ATCC 64411 / 73-15) TaxID=644358 RepID=A0A0C4E9R3_MAGP6|nr:alpha-glucosidase [Magnaporthiopsis poae ATCC 64411]
MADLGLSHAHSKKWWKEAVVYQVYPSSFKDTNGDGVGDLPGIIEKLDHIQSLGATVIWVCPMYDSPQVDLGYDIRDYEKVYPPYGTMQDMQNLIDSCHARGMRIILDLVINHTSDQHAWFQESRASKASPKRDWYIWRPARRGPAGERLPPNNWRSNFGSSVWTWDDASQEYYLHLFAPEQPDLNWENAETRRAIYASAMESWLRRGVDGFRVDTVNMYSKAPGLPDAPVVNPAQEWQFAAGQFCNGPRMFEYLDEMNKVMEGYDTMTVGELPHTPDLGRVLKYVSAAEKKLDMVFQFDVVDTGFGKDVKYDTTPFNWTLPEFKRRVLRTQSLISGTDAWTTSFLENHDQARSISRFASDVPEHRVQSGKLLCLLSCTLSGTLFVYQGQEIGMVNMSKDWPMDEYKDIESGNYYREVQAKVAGTPDEASAMAAAKASLQHLARDHARVPMCWDDSPQGGFSTNPATWMRTHHLAGEINVAFQTGDPASVLGFWRKTLRLRREYADVLVYGDFEIDDIEDPSTFVYTKSNGAETALVMLNFTAVHVDAKVPTRLAGASFQLVASTYEDTGTDDGLGKLRPFEGRFYVAQSGLK